MTSTETKEAPKVLPELTADVLPNYFNGAMLENAVKVLKLITDNVRVVNANNTSIETYKQRARDEFFAEHPELEDVQEKLSQAMAIVEKLQAQIDSAMPENYEENKIAEYKKEARGDVSENRKIVRENTKLFENVVKFNGLDILDEYKLPSLSTVSSNSLVNREQLAAIRDWAKNNGFEVADRGRISQEIQDAYHNAKKS